MRVLVTGASGFVGTAFTQSLVRRGISVVAATTRPIGIKADGIRWLMVKPDFVDIANVFPEQIDAVVHLAARVHQMDQHDPASLQRYRATNRDATLAVAAVAALHGVGRFIFVSSIKAIAEVDAGRALNEQDIAVPLDGYGLSKREAEEGLMALRCGGFQPTILRVPLVYGPGVRANFASLWRAVARGVPLPLGAAHAERSLLGMDNLVAALGLCLEHPLALGETFHIADEVPVSVRNLILAMASAMHRPARLVTLPAPLLLADRTYRGASPAN